VSRRPPQVPVQRQTQGAASSLARVPKGRQVVAPGASPGKACGIPLNHCARRIRAHRPLFRRVPTVTTSGRRHRERPQAGSLRHTPCSHEEGFATVDGESRGNNTDPHHSRCTAARTPNSRGGRYRPASVLPWWGHPQDSVLHRKHRHRNQSFLPEGCGKPALFQKSGFPATSVVNRPGKGEARVDASSSPSAATASPGEAYCLAGGRQPG